MIRILFFLALGVVLGHAIDPVQDKFDLSVTGLAVKGNTLEFTLKIVNQSATPVQIDLSTEVVVLKADKDKPSLQAQTVSTRPGIYKPRIVILGPGNHVVFLPSKSSRLFAPKVLTAGGSLELTKAISLASATFLKDVNVQPYRLFLNLAYRTDANPDCQATAPSPTYQMSADASGKLALTAQ